MSRFTRAAFLLLGSTLVLFQGCGCDDRPDLGEDCHTVDEHSEPLTCKEEGNDCLKSDGSKCTTNDTAGCSCKESQPALGAKCHSGDPHAEPLTCRGEFDKCLADDGTPCLQSHTSGCTCKRDCTAALTRQQCLANEHCNWKRQNTRRGLQAGPSCGEEEVKSCDKVLTKEQCENRKGSACIWVAQKTQRRLMGLSVEKCTTLCSEADTRQLCEDIVEKRVTRCLWDEDHKLCFKKCKNHLECHQPKSCHGGRCVDDCSNDQTCERFGLLCLNVEGFACPGPTAACSCLPGAKIDETCKVKPPKPCQEGVCLSSETGQVCDEKDAECTCQIPVAIGEECARSPLEGFASLCDDDKVCLTSDGFDCNDADAFKNINDLAVQDGTPQVCVCQEGLSLGESCQKKNDYMYGCEKNAQCLSKNGGQCGSSDECFCQYKLEKSAISYTLTVSEILDKTLYDVHKIASSDGLTRILNTPIDLSARTSIPTETFIGTLKCGGTGENCEAHDRKVLTVFALYAKACTSANTPVNRQWITYTFKNTNAQSETRQTYFYCSIPASSTINKSIHSEMLRLVHYFVSLRPVFKDKLTLERVSVGGGSSPCFDCTLKAIENFYALLSADFKSFQTSFQYDNVYRPKYGILEDHFSDIDPYFSTWASYILNVHLRSIMISQTEAGIAYLKKLTVKYMQNRKSLSSGDYKRFFDQQRSENLYKHLRNMKLVFENNETAKNKPCNLEDMLGTLFADLGKLNKLPKTRANLRESVITAYIWAQMTFDCFDESFFDSENIRAIIDLSVKSQMEIGIKKRERKEITP